MCPGSQCGPVWNTCLDSATPSSTQARPPLTSRLFSLTLHLHDGEDEGQVRRAVEPSLVVNASMLSSALFLESPPLPPPGSVILRRTLTAQPIVLPTAMTYCRKRIQGRISQENGTWVEVLEKPGTSFQEVSRGGGTQGVLNSPSNEL